MNVVGMNTSSNTMAGEGDRNKGFSKKEKLVEAMDDEMRSVCSELFDMESKYEDMVLAHEELQEKYEEAQLDIGMKDKQIAALQQTLQDKRQHSLLVGPAGDCSMSVEELQSQVSQQEELHSEKDRQIRRWRRLAKNHRAALYKLDDTMSALDAAKSKCEALQKDLREQLTEKNERHLQNLRRKEKAFQNELSNKTKNLKEFANREKNLTVQFSKKVASLEVELSEREVTFQMKLSEREKTFQMKLSEKEKSFQIELSERETSFQIELEKREETLKEKLSAREESLQKEVSEIEETYKNTLSEREESLQKEVSANMELSQLSEHWQKTAQQLREENIQLQELLVAKDTKRKKRGFWSRLFKQ